MVRHLFILIWNKRKQHFLLMFEMLVSFMVIFGVFSLMVYYYQNYRKPMNFDYDRVWVINYNNALKTNNSDSLSLFYENVRKTLRSMPQIKGVSYASANLPFTETTNSTGLTYKNNRLNRINNFIIDDEYAAVLNVRMLDGRWFNKTDAVSTNRPVVIDAALKEAFFGKEDAIGKFIGSHDNKTKMKVIGVVGNLKSRGITPLSVLPFLRG